MVTPESWQKAGCHPSNLQAKVSARLTVNNLKGEVPWCHGKSQNQEQRFQALAFKNLRAKWTSAAEESHDAVRKSQRSGSVTLPLRISYDEACSR